MPGEVLQGDHLFAWATSRVILALGRIAIAILSGSQRNRMSNALHSTFEMDLQTG